MRMDRAGRINQPMRTPPITMATQHPDNAGAPWWHDDAFIATQDEITELLTLFQELPIDEYMWDWEGKYVDEAVGEKLFSRAKDYFQKHPLGEDLHLTYRIPAWEEGRKHRMARAFIDILSLADFAKEIGLNRPPVTEMFLPLTTSAEQPIGVRRTFRETADYHRTIFHASREDEHHLLELLEVTPLVEDIDSLFHIERILKPYWQELAGERGAIPEHLRVFLARSDPALNAGLVSAVLAVKTAISTIHQLAHEVGSRAFPLIGTGSLPFRGGVNPETTQTFLDQYAGTHTYSIQSAFRYDYPLASVRSALQTIRQEVPLRTAKQVPEGDHEHLWQLIRSFTEAWQPTIEAIAPLINTVGTYVPSRRERLLHIGLFGYSRGMGSVKLPRAIVFTAALYSLGVPPELIATGRGLKRAEELHLLPLLETYYPALREELRHAGHFLNRENLALLTEKCPAFEGVFEDIGRIEQILGVELMQIAPEHIIHRNLTSTILHRLQSDHIDPATMTRDIVEAAKLRRSLG